MTRSRAISTSQFVIVFCVVFSGVSGCKLGWFSYGDQCFRISSPRARMQATARLMCMLDDSDLVSLSDEFVLQFMNTHISTVATPHDNHFWVGLHVRHDDGKLMWMDGKEADGQSWVQQPENSNSRYRDLGRDLCFAYNGTMVVTVSCHESHRWICGHKKRSPTKSSCHWGIQSDHSFIGELSKRCIFRPPEKVTKENAEDTCAKYFGQFQDLDDILKESLGVSEEHWIESTNEDRYWTGVTWNGTNAVWKSGEILSDEYTSHFVTDSGSCVIAHFNHTDNFQTHLYRTECDVEAYVICALGMISNEKTATTTSEELLEDAAYISDTDSCPPGFSWKVDSTTGYCYWETSYETKHMPWENAEKYCQSYGGHLASLHSEAEEKIGLSFQYGSLSHPFWIGLTLDGETGEYKWSDGSTLNYTNWAPGHPDHRDKRLRCVTMNAKEKHWESTLCGVHSWFICKVPRQSNPQMPTLPTPAPLQLCDSYSDDNDKKLFYFENSCYILVSETVSWHRAKQFCENNGAKLVSVHSDAEVGFLLKLLYESSFAETDRVWIGLNVLGPDESLHWADWTPVDFTYFNKDEPNNYMKQEKCCNMNTGNGMWNDENCNSELGFICKRSNDTSETTVIPSTSPPATGYCKTGWIVHDDRCYYVGGKRMNDRVNWSEALDICGKKGGYLTSVQDEKEQGFLSYLLQSLGVDAWIGFHDTILAGKYYWVDNSDVQYTHWAPGEPSYVALQEDCVKMVYDDLDSGVWRDDKCERKLGFICQSRKDPTLPEPTYYRGYECLHPEGWMKLDTRCFEMFGGNFLTWQEAEDACRYYNGHLVSITDKGVKAIVSYLAAKANMSFWIGLQYKESTQSFSWMNGWPFTISNWEKNEPGFMKENTCIASTAEGYWKKVDCTERMPFICQITTGKPMKQQKYTGDCPATSNQWKPGSGSYCYIVNNVNRSDWFQDNLQCSRQGSHLTSIHSLEEIESLKKFMTPDMKSVYIGMRRNSKAGFMWMDDSPVNFVNWDEEEPQNYNDECVEMMADTMKWRVTACNAKKLFICQDNKVSLSIEDPQIAVLEPLKGLSASSLAIIIIGSLALLLVILAGALFYYKRSTGKHDVDNISIQHNVTFENALYNVNSSSMEFQDEKLSL